MIIDIDEKKDSKYFNMLQKARGIKLIYKYLPNLLIHKQLYVVNNIEEWNKIKDKFPETVTIRTDNKNGMPIPNIGGTTCKKNEVEQYFKKAYSIEKEPYFLCMELEAGTGERINTLGGILIDVTMGGTVYVGYVGPCFDCRELTKGKAEHETWKIPWNDLLFIKPSNLYQYHTQTISQKAYISTAIERMCFLVSEYPERTYEIVEKMPGKYLPVKPQIMENLIEQVLVPLYMQKEELLKDGLNKFDVEMNVLSSGRIIPMEICRPERFIKKDKKNEKER